MAQLLARAADSLRGTAGCELYLTTERARSRLVWVTELWLSQEALDASLEHLNTDEGKAQIAEVTGVSHQRLRAGMRQAFGHRHQHAEEVFVIAGTGRLRIDDEIRDVRPLDAIRIAPDSARAFEAGPDGLEFLVFGPHHTGDAVMDPNFWPEEEG